MRWILAACLFVATYAVVPTPTLDKAYQGGWEYIYRYDSQLLTGLPTVDDQYSGFKVNGDARLQFTDQSGYLKVIMKLDNVAVFKVHGNLGKEVLPNSPLPEHLLEPITHTQQGEVLKSNITKTCSFIFKNGEIKELRVEEDEPNWSVNFKKGIVQLLKVQIKERDSHYTVTEEDVLGKCESQYTLNSMRPYLRLNKIRHLDSCVEKPLVEVGLFSGLPESQKELLDPTVHYEYVLYTENEHFAINQVELKSTYVFSPTQKSTDSVVTYTRQAMVFQRFNEIRTPLGSDRLTKVEDSLVYTVPTPLLSNNKRDHRSYVPQSNTDENRLSAVDQVLTTILGKMRTPIIEESAPQYFLQLDQLLSGLSYNDIMNLVRKYNCNDEVCERKLEILLDCVPTLPTDLAAEVIITLIKEKIVTGYSASLMINTLALTANPTPKVIDECMQLYKTVSKGNTIEDKLVARATILCIGTLANRMDNMQKKIGMDNQATKPILRGLIAELRSQLRSSTTNEEKLRLVKTIGNFGEPSFLPELKTICEDKTLPIDLRDQAIFAMRKFANNPDFRDHVLEVVLSLFMNTQEETRVRTAAFLVVVASRPAYRQYEMIGHKMETEPSHQMKSLVYTVFVKLAKSKTAERWSRDQTEYARRCLKFMTPVETMPWDTQMMHTEVYSEMTKIGGYVDGIVVKSPRSMLPSALVGCLKGTMFGKYFNLVEAGITTDGLDGLIKKIVNWLTTDGDKTVSSILRLLESNEQTTIQGSYISEQINKILNKLSVEDMDDAEFKAMAYIKLNAQEMQYTTLNKEDLIDIFRTQNFNTITRNLFEGKPFRWNKVVSLRDNSYALPSPMGVPVYLNFTLLHIHSFVGELKIEGFESVVSSMMSGNSLSLDNLKLKVKTDISTRTGVTVSMGSTFATIQTGAANKFKVHSDIPIDVEVSFESNSGKLIIKQNIPNEKIELFTFVAEPYTFFTKNPTEQTLSAWRNEYHMEKLPLGNPTIDRPYNYDYSLPLLVIPVSIDVETKLRLGNPRWSASFPMIGKQEIYVTLNKNSARVPTILYEIDLNDTPYLFECNEASRGNYRTSRPSSYDYESKSGLPSVRPDESFVQKCPAVKIPMLITTDDNSGKRIEMQITGIRSPDWMIHQITFQLVGKSLYGLPHGFQNINLVTETVVNIQSMIEGNSRYPIAKFTFGLGTNSFDENKIVLKIVKDAPEHIFESNYRTPSNQQPETYKYTVSIEYNELSQELKEDMYTAKHYLEPLYRQYLNKVDASSVQVGRNEIKCYLKIVPQWEKVFVVIDLPTGDRYTAKLPWVVAYLRPLSLNEPYSLIVPPYSQGMSHMDKLTGYGKCVLDKTSMKTFDGHNVNLPRVFFEPNCEMLVSRDCSQKHSFTLTMKPTDRTGQKAIKLVVQEYKIEVTPTTQKHWYSWNKDVDFEVRINDEEVSLNSNNQPLTLKSKQSTRSEPLYEVKEVDSVIDVTCLKSGLKVIFDGSVVKVTPSAMYQGQLCGLCGDYNMDSSDDVKRIHVSSHESLKEHFLKNIITSDKCQAQGL